MTTHVTSAAAAQLLARDIRLAFFDIDGTLLGRDGRYSERVKRAIAAARQQGIKTAVASGRPKFAADFLIRQLGLVDAGLFYTGALLYDPRAEQRLALHALSDELVARLLDAAQSLDLYIEVCTESHFYIEHMGPLGQSHSEHLRVAPTVRPFEQIVGREPVVKLLFAVDNLQAQEKLYRLERDFPEAVFAYARMASQPDWLFASVICSQACKRKGFSHLLDYHSVTAEQVIAFGDAQSDMTFLSLAGVGVAMGNASDEVKAVAALETLPVWDDGVAVVLEKVLETMPGKAAQQVK
ncbi:MAG: HAD family hydrolase [Gammaproteobacteria bacterium]|nr:HAD family hydrolase [Gammaproteobacteria bacterium]